MKCSFVQLSRRFDDVRYWRAFVIVASLVFCGFASCLSNGLAQDVEIPAVLDERLEMTLFADSDEIVTPIGMAIDAADRMFVIESHTHLTPPGYDGPDSDRIKVFDLGQTDGGPRCSIFASGLKEAMNLAFSPKGDLYVVCARRVVRLPDDDGDGVADRIETVLTLDTKERYAHNSLLAITFDVSGQLYVSRGNTGSRYYAVRGTDGSFVEGYGDGGNVVCSNADGTEVREFATGFWNAFDLKFNSHGELLLVDNDPDARGPNRLLKVVEHGDYGYLSIFGGSGTHPMQGWDGSMPGTLPFIAGTGEAPSGLIDLKRSSFPADYSTSALVTIWNENSIERFDLRRTQAGIQAEKSVLVRGGKDFRPVALDCDSAGNLWVTDWVLVDYPNHGSGRIWKIGVREDGYEEVLRLSPGSYFEMQSAASGTANQRDPSVVDGNASSSGDPLSKFAGYTRMDRWVLRDLLASDIEDERLNAFVALLRLGMLDPKEIREALSDPTQKIRLAALRAAVLSYSPELGESIDQVLHAGEVSGEIFEAWLSAKRVLNSDYCEAVKSRAEDRSNSIPQAAVNWDLIAEMLKSEQTPNEVQIKALEYLPAETLLRYRHDFLRRMLSTDTSLVTACLVQLRRLPDLAETPEVQEMLIQIVADERRSPEIRTRALFCIDVSRYGQGEVISLATETLKDSTTESVTVALVDRMRDLGFVDELSKLRRSLMQDRDAKLPRRIMESFAAAGVTSGEAQLDKPTSIKEWARLPINMEGNVLRGERVFLSTQVGCSKCHSMRPSETTLGPSLMRVASSKSKAQIVEAILSPSANFPPQYQAWIVMTEDNQVFRGLQLDHKSGGAIVLTLDDGSKRRFDADEILDYKALPNSLMPDSLQETMTPTEFVDLVAYLCELR
ncbi:MAG: PVC-type heme-binding CxxCH protein [Aureliella sp.]